MTNRMAARSLCLAVAMAVAGWPIAAVPAQAQVAAGATAMARTGAVMEVPVNKSQVLQADRPFAQVLVGNPAIADVVPLTNRSVYVLGKQQGSTSLTLYDRNRQLIAVVDLVIGPDVQGLKRQLSDLLPSEQVGVRISNDSLVLTGVVSSSAFADRARQLAETYAPGKVVNLLSVGSSQQVMLEVRFSEMRRTVARSLGINSAFVSDSGRVVGGIGDDAPATALLSDQNGRPIVNIGAISEAFGVLGGNFSIGDLNITGVIDALERKGLITTLAEPTLIALSGETASFLAGGEFPIPVAQSSNTGSGGNVSAAAISVEFKQFGVSLAFTPTVLADGVINLAVAPEVSSIDASASVSIGGLVIPGLQTRRALTTLELRDGQSFAMAGLIRNDFQDTVRQIPLLGNIPIIGTLFRSSGFQRSETELVMIVTPRLVRPTSPDRIVLPTDRVKAPSELDLFLLGRTDTAVGPGKLREGDPRDQGGLNPAPGRSGGIDGTVGHIVR